MAHGRPLGLTSLCPATHATHALCSLRRRTLAHVCLLYFRSPAPICSDAHQCLLERGVSVFFFLLFLLAHQCSQLSSLPSPPSSTFFPPWPPLAVGCGGDNHQAARIRADTHQRRRPNPSQREICSRACQERLCCQG